MRQPLVHGIWKPQINIPIPAKIGSKMGGAPTPKWDPIVLNHRHLCSLPDPSPLSPGFSSTDCALGSGSSSLARVLGSQSGTDSPTKDSETVFRACNWFWLRRPRRQTVERSSGIGSLCHTPLQASLPGRQRRVPEATVTGRNQKSGEPHIPESACQKSEQTASMWPSPHLRSG